MDERSTHHVLVSGDPDDRRAELAGILRQAGFGVIEASSLSGAERELACHDVALVVVEAGDDVDALAVDRLQLAARPARVGLVGALAAEGAAFVLPRPLAAEDLLAAVSSQVRSEPLPPAWERVVRAYFDALSYREWDGLVALCHPDVVYELPGPDPLGRRLIGRAALRAHVEEAFAGFPGASFVIESLLPAPHMAIARYAASWWTPEGVARLGGAVCFQFDGEQIVTIGVRLDMARARRGVRD